jgi:hypothetical protein
MYAPWLLLAVLTATGSAAPVQPVWQKIYDGGDDHRVSLVAATGRNDWVAAGGRWGLATAHAGAVHIQDTHGRGVLGLFPASPGDLYALGEGELIWHLEGQAWKEEHVAPLPARGRRPFADHMLYVGYVGASAEMVAVGLTLAFQRKPDGSWSLPSQAERDKLRETGLSGPAFAAPVGCARAEWQWLGPHRGAFVCHDRRAFIWDAGAITARGKLPPVCDVVGSMIEAEDTLYASCQFASLWKTESDKWRRLVPPREAGLKELGGLSFAEGCLFVAGNRSLWRACDR